MKEEKEIIEKIAAVVHEQWSHWMEYMIQSKCISLTNFNPRIHKKKEPPNLTMLVFKHEDINRWFYQRNTSYSELSEKEKDSDRNWAKKVLDIIDKDSMIISKTTAKKIYDWLEYIENEVIMGKFNDDEKDIDKFMDDVENDQK